MQNNQYHDHQVEAPPLLQKRKDLLAIPESESESESNDILLILQNF